jgi:hypothetical protein
MRTWTVSKRTWQGMSCEGSSVGVDKRTVWGLFVQIHRSYILIQGGLCTALGQALICITGGDPFRAGRLLVRGWSKRESFTAADCAAGGQVTWLVTLSSLIFPMVFHVLINGRVALPKFTQSRDRVGDQSFDRSPDGFPRSHADWSHDTWEVVGSCDESGDWITWCFPGSHARGFGLVFITWLWLRFRGGFLGLVYIWDGVGIACDSTWFSWLKRHLDPCLILQIHLCIR